MKTALTIHANALFTSLYNPRVIDIPLLPQPAPKDSENTSDNLQEILNQEAAEESNPAEPIAFSKKPISNFQIKDDLEWVKKYKKVKEIIETPEWNTIIKNEYGGKIPKISKMSLIELTEFENRIWNMLSLGHPFDLQWFTAGLAMDFFENIAVGSGYDEYEGVATVIKNDKNLYLLAKQYSLQYFDFNLSNNLWKLGSGLYQDISLVANVNKSRLRATTEIMQLPATDGFLKYLDENKL